MKTNRKQAGEYAVKKSFSLPEALFQDAANQARTLGFPCFSDYLQHLIRTNVRPQGAAFSR